MVNKRKISWQTCWSWADVYKFKHLRGKHVNYSANVELISISKEKLNKIFTVQNANLYDTYGIRTHADKSTHLASKRVNHSPKFQWYTL